MRDLTRKLTGETPSTKKEKQILPWASDRPLTHLRFVLRGTIEKAYRWEKGMQGLMFKYHENGPDPQLT